MTVTARRENTRSRLLDAAYELFAEVGLDAASVEAVSERAGFTRGAFYSNFDSKDELMLALTSRLAEEKIELVTERIAQLRASGEELSPAQIVERVLDAAMDEKPGVLLTGEIRVRAMRDPVLAKTYLAWRAGMVERIAQVIADVTTFYRLQTRLPIAEISVLVLQTWEDTAATAVIEGRDFASMCRIVNERTAGLAAALVDPI